MQNKNKESSLFIETLEARFMPSVSSVFINNGLLTITCNHKDSKVQITEISGEIKVADLDNGKKWVYKGVSQVVFNGGNGNDVFENFTKNIPSRAYGNHGNDILIGSAGTDYFFGGNGNDVLAGKDGGDSLVGGMGTDNMDGGNGNDVLVGMDGSSIDLLKGGPGKDAFWIDQIFSNLETPADGSIDDNVLEISSFANQADLTLDGDKLADPAIYLPTPKNVFRHMDVSSMKLPLFASYGPKMDDIFQGSLGDCWLMASLSAISRDTPLSLRQNIVDFGDNTYGVHLGSSFYRVDSDLVFTSKGEFAYALPGRQGALWVAVVEKAFAFHASFSDRNKFPTPGYDSLDGGFSNTAREALRAFSTGEKWFSEFSSANSLLNFVSKISREKQAVSIGFDLVLKGKESLGKKLPLIMGHEYTFAGFQKNSKGEIVGIILRNPWGIDGKTNPSDLNDGLVTVNPKDLFNYKGSISWGRIF